MMIQDLRKRMEVQTKKIQKVFIKHIYVFHLKILEHIVEVRNLLHLKVGQQILVGTVRVQQIVLHLEVGRQVMVVEIMFQLQQM